MNYNTYKRIMEGIGESKFKFFTPTKLQITDAVIIYRDFSGQKYGTGNRTCTIAITPELAAEFDNMGLPYKKFEVQDENGNVQDGMVVYAITSKVKYRSAITGAAVAYPPEVSFINANGVEVALDEESVGTLDHARLKRCCFVINYYQNKDGRMSSSIKKFKSIMEPIVEFDGIFDEYKTAEPNAEAAALDPNNDDDQVPFDVE